MKQNQFIFGIIIGVIAVVLTSSKAVLVKLTYLHNIDEVAVLFLRMLFSFPFYVVMAVFYKTTKTTANKLSNKDYFFVLLFGVSGFYLASYFDFVGLTYISAGLERIILFIYPTIILFLNKLFFKIPITKAQITAILLSYFGVVLAFFSEFSISSSEFKTIIGGFFVLLSAVTYALYIVGSGWLIPRFDVIKFTSYAMIIASICVFIHYFTTYSLEDIFSYPLQVYTLGFLTALLATVIPSYLMSYSIKLISSSNYAIVAGIGPIATIIMAALFLKEEIISLQIIGMLLVVVGIIIISMQKKKVK